MKKQHLFTLDVDLVKKLHKEVARGHRSKFVEKAIRKALSGRTEFDLWDVEVKELMKILRSRASIMEDDVLHAILHNRLEEME